MLENRVFGQAGGGKHLQEQLLKYLQFDTFNRFGLYG